MAEEVKEILRTADCVCFDVDSTVCVDEAIDELAEFVGAGEAVARLTREAMQGSMTYKQSLGARLKLMQPSQQDLRDFLEKHPPRLTPGIQDLVQVLHNRGVAVYLISGGFIAIIEKVAEVLNIPVANIYANEILFYYNGKYAGFDEAQPTSETGGKPRVINKLKQEFGYKRVVHIGDGMTDMEACPPAHAFIGFGGNQVREKVKQGSKWFVMDMSEMTDVLT